jgi:hypothetical protein
LNEEDQAEYESLWIVFKESCHSRFVKAAPQVLVDSVMFNSLRLSLRLDPSLLRNDPKKLLLALRKYICENVMYDPILGYINFDDVDRVNSISLEDINRLCSNPKIIKYLPALIRNIVQLQPDHFLTLMRIKGLDVEFEKQCFSLSINLENVLQCFKMKGVLDSFVQKFGERRLEILRTQVSAAKTYQRIHNQVGYAIKSHPVLFGIGLGLTGAAICRITKM